LARNFCRCTRYDFILRVCVSIGLTRLVFQMYRQTIVIWLYVGQRTGHRGRICEKPGFRRRVVETFAHLGYYTAQVGRLLQTFRDYLQGEIFKGQEYQNPCSLTVNMGPRLSRNVGDNLKDLKDYLICGPKKCYVKRPLAARPSRCSNSYLITGIVIKCARIWPGYFSKFILSGMKVHYNILVALMTHHDQIYCRLTAPALLSYSHSSCCCSQHIIQQMHSVIKHLWQTPTPSGFGTMCHAQIVITKVYKPTYHYVCSTHLCKND
jgi:hypothetical protein